MKKILITGANSFIGTSFEQWVHQWPDSYSVDVVDMIDSTWRDKDFSAYDVVFHVAGIAHVDTKKATKGTRDLYYKVNRDLTIEIATKAKQDGVKQFIFMSSIIVYGDSSSINKKRIIDLNTLPQPSNFYGNSKLQAEEGIKVLESNKFRIVVLRPPMIYGKGSKGNYPKLASYAQKLPIFPNVNNQRSMLYIDNLSEFIRLMIDNEEQGLFFPQNLEYVKTSEMVRIISGIHNKKIKLTKVFNPLLRIMGNFVDVVNKAFGNLVYEQSMSDYRENYRVSDLKESIIKTEI